VICTDRRSHRIRAAAFLLLLAISSSLLGSSSQNSETCTVIYADGLVLSGQSMRVLEHETICLIGRIVLRDEATLVIRDSELRTVSDDPSPWGYGTEIVLLDESHLELVNVTIRATERNFAAHANNASTITMSNVKLAPGSGQLDVSAHQNAVITVDESHVGIALASGRGELKLAETSIKEMALVFSEGAAQLSGLRPARLLSWDSASLASDSDFFSVSVERCDISTWSVAVEGTAFVEVQDSELGIVRMEAEGASGILEGYAARYYTSWDSAQGGLVAPVRLSLRDTEITGYVAFVAPGRTDLEIRDCDIGWLCFSKGHTSTRLVETEVGNFGLIDILGDIEFIDSIFQGCLNAEGAFMIWSGDLAMDDACVLHWEDSMVSRELVVAVLDTDSVLMGTSDIELFKPDGTTATAVTNLQGKASFQVWYSDANYARPRTLRVSSGTSTQILDVGFLTSSPVYLQLL